MEKLFISIHPHQAKSKELLRACHMISDQTHEVPGCMDSRIRAGIGEEKTIHLEQYWSERHLLDDYFRSDHFSAMLGAMKLLGENYEITLNDGALKEGMNAVEHARAT